jgi:energy-coupling factor transporter ATP-binding protein EcfA2
MMQEPITEMGIPPLESPNPNFETNKPVCWSRLDDDEFLPSYSTQPKVPSGVYEIVWNTPHNTYTLKKQPFKTDELYHLPSPEIMSILDDINSFWNRVEIYKEYRFVHKRGVLLYGQPGCGKSGIIQLLSKLIMEKDGIVINVKDEDDVDSFTKFIPTFRNIEPNRPLVVILEDIDSIAGENKYQISRLLNILDGVKQFENVVYIATTNYPEKLQERITNRPSRFDRRYKIEPPNREIREAYLRNKLTENDLKSININEWIKRTEGMSLSHLKELVISTIVLGHTFEDTIRNLEGLKVTPTAKGDSNMGFNIKRVGQDDKYS